VLVREGTFTFSEILEAERLEDYKVIRWPHRTLEAEANDEPGHVLAIDVLERIGLLEKITLSKVYASRKGRFALILSIFRVEFSHLYDWQSGESVVG